MFVRPVENVVYLLNAFNQLGIVWSQFGELEKAIHSLRQAEELYNLYKSETQPGSTASSSLGPSSLSSDQVKAEKLHTLTLFYLAQVLSSQGETDESALYCELTLARVWYTI
jgi:tetratricopeptide (TPR) repeat protein